MWDSRRLRHGKLGDRLHGPVIGGKPLAHDPVTVAIVGARHPPSEEALSWAFGARNPRLSRRFGLLAGGVGHHSPWQRRGHSRRGGSGPWAESSGSGIAAAGTAIGGTLNGAVGGRSHTTPSPSPSRTLGSNTAANPCPGPDLPCTVGVPETSASSQEA